MAGICALILDVGLYHSHDKITSLEKFLYVRAIDFCGLCFFIDQDRALLLLLLSFLHSAVRNLLKMTTVLDDVPNLRMVHCLY
jgi:hypothetical protein